MLPFLPVKLQASVFLVEDQLTLVKTFFLNCAWKQIVRKYRHVFFYFWKKNYFNNELICHDYFTHKTRFFWSTFYSVQCNFFFVWGGWYTSTLKCWIKRKLCIFIFKKTCSYINIYNLSQLKYQLNTLLTEEDKRLLCNLGRRRGSFKLYYLTYWNKKITLSMF